MRTENTYNPADALFFGLGLALLLLLHFFALSRVPGLHFDEAWALNHAWSIAEGQWTLEAMSPYTAPWAHYWGALWMKLFGPGLFVFRFSQMLLTLGGIFFLVAALWQSGRRLAAALFPLAVALLPALGMNHRFAIELNGLHVLCLGGVAWALVRRMPLTAVSFWVIGTTGHILFYGVGLAVVGAVFWEGRELRARERFAAGLGCVLLGLFFFRVYQLIPEKGKALALMGSTMVVLLALALRAERWAFWRKPWWEILFLCVSLVFLFNALLFADGFWSLSLTTGKEGWKGARLLNLLVFLPVFFFLVKRGSTDSPRYLRRAFLLGVICLGFMMLKPAPRYYEMIFLLLAVFLAQGLALLPFLARMATLLLLLLHSTVLFSEYFTVSPKETELRFLFFKDSSRDFLSKQALVSFLAGCDLSDIQSVDGRVREALVALSRQDWPKGRPCPWHRLNIERRAETARTGVNLEVADFVIWENP